MTKKASQNRFQRSQGSYQPNLSLTSFENPGHAFLGTLNVTIDITSSLSFATSSMQFSAQMHSMCCCCCCCQ